MKKAHPDIWSDKTPNPKIPYNFWDYNPKKTWNFGIRRVVWCKFTYELW